MKTSILNGSLNSNSPGRDPGNSELILEELAYSCSHSMCSPLKTIMGLVNLLAEESDKSQANVYLELILTCVSKLEDLTKDVDQLLENMEKNLKAEPLNLTVLIERVLEKFASDLRSRNINVIVQVEQPGLFYADRERIVIMLTHILTNAITFCDDGKAHKKILIHAAVNAEECEIRIGDNGCGIPPEMQAKIFRPFYRGSEKSTGSGLGLFVVKELLKKTGGSISVHSEFKQRTEFCICIPNSVRTNLIGSTYPG